jgi:hypothetical protein
MFIEELELLLGRTTSFEQFANGLEPHGPVAQGNLACLVDGLFTRVGTGVRNGGNEIRHGFHLRTGLLGGGVRVLPCPFCS